MIDIDLMLNAKLLVQQDSNYDDETLLVLVSSTIERSNFTEFLRKSHESDKTNKGVFI